MLITDWRPKVYCKDMECQNLSPNGKVLFIEEGHKYYHSDDIVDGVLTDFNSSKFQFRSPTGLLKNFYTEFDTIPQAKKYVEKHSLPITWEQLVYSWEMIAHIASEEGTELHGYGESLWNGWGMPAPASKKAPMVREVYAQLKEKYTLSRTELLVYSGQLRLAGQVDLLLKNAAGTEYAIMDYKFLKKDIETKSFYNPKTKQYKMMNGPFRKLQDCNHNHYSIQMEIYRYLMGVLGEKVTRKTLIVVTPEKYELVEGRPMIIWVDSDGVLHAKYKLWNGKIFNSSKDPKYLKKPFRLI